MTFNEKSRWIALLANLVVWGWYFLTVVRAVEAGYPDRPQLMWIILPVIGALTVIHVVAHAAIALMKPSEARIEMDERERAISHRASAWGYNLLCAGVFFVITGSFFWWNSFLIVNALLFAFILSESVRLTAEIVLYRRMGA